VLRAIAGPGNCAVGRAHALGDVAGALLGVGSVGVWRPAPAAESMTVKLLDILKRAMTRWAPAGCRIAVLTCGASTLGNGQANVFECVPIGRDVDGQSGVDEIITVLKSESSSGHAAPPKTLADAVE
jgi:hypothetical protein